MIAKLLTLSRILRESVPFNVALSDAECERSDAARDLERHADVLSAAGCARESAYSTLDFAIEGGVAAARAECARTTAALALARKRADAGLRAAAALVVSA
jgi:hypothetical protein